MIPNSKMSQNRLLLYLRLAFWLIVPLVLLLLPASYFDTGKPKCLSILLTGEECYGCGMTRAIMHLIHFDASEAVYHHPLVLIVFPLLAFLWARYFWQDVRLLRKPA